MRIFVLIVCQLFFLTEATAISWKDFKLRARESYEVLTFEATGMAQDQKYSGLTNTINLFYEKPFNYSFGLAGGSIFSGLNNSNNQDNLNLSDRITISFVGLESKIFFLASENKGFFFRPGAYWQNLHREGEGGDIPGSALLIGAGYEFLVYKNVSLAPELAYKIGEASPYSWSGYTISLGVHFYKF